MMVWIEFYKDVLGFSDRNLSIFYDMLSSLERGKPGFLALEFLYECLSDINRVLVLSQSFGIPIYDWEDYTGYYKYKFMRVGKRRESQSLGKTISEMFDVFIPNYKITDYHQLLDIRNDKRLDAVREIAASLGRNAITKDLVIQAYKDVLVSKKDEETFSKYTGLIGLLLSMFPGPVGDVFQVAANSIFKRWRERDIQWQAFFVERSIQYSKNSVENKLRDIV